MSPRAQSPHKLKLNTGKLIKFALSAKPIFPRYFGVEVSHAGIPKMVPSVGGITYNVQIGDSAFGWEADHIEPGVSLGFESQSDKKRETALNHFSCIGNGATLLSEKGKGAKGVVVGHHGGVEHVMVDLPHATLKKLTYDDKFLIEAWGMGLQAPDYPDVVFRNLDPDLALKLFVPLSEGRLRVPARTRIPAKLMGSGLGHTDSTSADYDIQTSDAKANKTYGLERLRLGDIVCLDQMKHTNGWSFQSGYVTFGVIVHGDSWLSGHGPGVTTICSGPEKRFVLDSNLDPNIGYHLGCGTFR